MQRIALITAGRVARTVSLILLSVMGTVTLMRLAPGYFTDSRELDATHSAATEAELARMRSAQSSVPALLRLEAQQWKHADLGRSRHYDVPVGDLLRQRAARSVRLLLEGTFCGWLLATALAFLLSARRHLRGEAWISASTALFLAVPIGAMATLCLLLNIAGPVFVLTLLIGVRDFKFLYRMLRSTWQEPYVFFARAQGYSATHIFRTHLFPALKSQLLALAVTSFTLALSALVPVEVVFDVPGLGQLAWDAAMNRDLPVLVAVTALLATCVGLAGLLTGPRHDPGLIQCA
jgi:peptide/nickel transport system permease protein